MPKRAILYLLGGIIIATGAVVMAQQYLSQSPQPVKPAFNTVKVAVTAENIAYGEPVVFESSDDRAANVKWVRWPKGQISGDHIQKGKGIGKASYCAKKSLAEGLLLRKTHMAEPGKLLPETTYIERIWIDEEKAARFIRGQRVDIFRRDQNDQIRDFIRYARIISVGELPSKLTEKKFEEARKEAGETPVFVVLKNPMRGVFKKVSKEGQLVVRPSRYGKENDLPYMLPVEPTQREKLARKQLEIVQSLAQQERYRAALQVVDDLIEQYSEMRISRTAQEERKTITNKWVENILGEAKTAYDRGYYQLTQERCEEVLNAGSIDEATESKISDLAEKAARKLKQRKREQKYQQLCNNISEALRGGDLPQVKKSLETLQKEYAASHIEAGVLSPDEVRHAVGEKLSELQKDFKVDMNILKYYFQQQKVEDAVEKLQEMEKRYAQHPRLEEVRDKMRQKGWLE